MFKLQIHCCYFRQIMTTMSRLKQQCTVMKKQHFGTHNNVTLPRIDSVIDRARRLGYCSPDTPTFSDLCDNVDDELFNKATLRSNHVLHALLPPTSAASQRYNLRQGPHLLQMPEHINQLSDCSFRIRMLYKDTY